jgi:LacI family transcriptional regulator
VAFFSRGWNIIHRLRYSAFERHWQGPAPLLLRPPFDRPLALAEKPLGVLAYNDIDAAFFINHCLDSGYRIPEDIAVLGIDNNEIICENQQIPISSIVHDLEQISYERAALLDRLMNGDAPPSEPILIKPRGIVTRTSTETIACSNTLVTKALSWIDAHLAEPFGSRELAEAVGVSRVKLDRLFSDSLQVSVSKTVLHLRIEKAKRMLLDPSLKLEYIAGATGFCHASHLSNAFKRATGSTPCQWAKTRISK